MLLIFLSQNRKDVILMNIFISGVSEIFIFFLLYCKNICYNIILLALNGINMKLSMFWKCTIPFCPFSKKYLGRNLSEKYLILVPCTYTWMEICLELNWVSTLKRLWPCRHTILDTPNPIVNLIFKNLKCYQNPLKKTLAQTVQIQKVFFELWMLEAKNTNR